MVPSSKSTSSKRSDALDGNAKWGKCYFILQFGPNMLGTRFQTNTCFPSRHLCRRGLAIPNGGAGRSFIGGGGKGPVGGGGRTDSAGLTTSGFLPFVVLVLLLVRGGNIGL